jgi:Nitrile hydratase beta subunit
MTIAPDLSGARAHDLGGQPAGAIERGEHEHEAEAWQNLVTALMYLLRDRCHLAKTDEMRRTVEDMNPADYRRLGYLDKWAVGVSGLVVEKGLMSRDEIERRVAGISARLERIP